MPDGDVIFILLRDKIAEQGIASVKKDATFHGKRHKREGSISGFQICSQLSSLKQFEEKLAKRDVAEMNWRKEGREIEDYWFHRCATGQIEFCYEALKVYVGGFRHYSARAAACCNTTLIKLKLEGKL